jgi:hypothetical protein
MDASADGRPCQGRAKGEPEGPGLYRARRKDKIENEELLRREEMHSLFF